MDKTYPIRTNATTETRKICVRTEGEGGAQGGRQTRRSLAEVCERQRSCLGIRRARALGVGEHDPKDQQTHSSKSHRHVEKRMIPVQKSGWCDKNAGFRLVDPKPKMNSVYNLRYCLRFDCIRSIRKSYLCDHCWIKTERKAPTPLM